MFHTGDLVYINITHFLLAPGLSNKLAPKWVGTFPIKQVIYSVAYRISPPKEYGHIHPVFIFLLYVETTDLYPSSTFYLSSS